MDDALSEILNFRRVSETLTTSGQPEVAQFAYLAAAGVRHVINLAPHDKAGALANEGEIVVAAGMQYHHIPVDFAAPTEADFNTFTEVLATIAPNPVHVHCIYNARVSAFMLRHIRERGGDAAAMVTIMDSIWRPGCVWATFLGDATRVNEAHAYAGYDY